MECTFSASSTEMALIITGLALLGEDLKNYNTAESYSYSEKLHNLQARLIAAVCNVEEDN